MKNIQIRLTVDRSISIQNNSLEENRVGPVGAPRSFIIPHHPVKS